MSHKFPVEEVFEGTTDHNESLVEEAKEESEEVLKDEAFESKDPLLFPRHAGSPYAPDDLGSFLIRDTDTEPLYGRSERVNSGVYDTDDEEWGVTQWLVRWGAAYRSKSVLPSDKFFSRGKGAELRRHKEEMRELRRERELKNNINE